MHFFPPNSEPWWHLLRISTHESGESVFLMVLLILFQVSTMTKWSEWLLTYKRQHRNYTHFLIISIVACKFPQSTFLSDPSLHCLALTYMYRSTQYWLTRTAKPRFLITSHAQFLEVFNKITNGYIEAPLMISDLLINILTEGENITYCFFWLMLSKILLPGTLIKP